MYEWPNKPSKEQIMGFLSTILATRALLGTYLFCGGFSDLPSSVMPLTSSSLIIINTVIPSLATTCPHAWQKHVLSANQNSKFWQSNFKVYPPTLKCFGATHPVTAFEGKQSRSATCLSIFVFGVLKIGINETPVFNLDAYSTLHRKTPTHILPFGRYELCDFIHDIF